MVDEGAIWLNSTFQLANYTVTKVHSPQPVPLLHNNNKNGQLKNQRKTFTVSERKTSSLLTMLLIALRESLQLIYPDRDSCCCFRRHNWTEYFSSATPIHIIESARRREPTRIINLVQTDVDRVSCSVHCLRPDDDKWHVDMWKFHANENVVKCVLVARDQFLLGV